MSQSKAGSVLETLAQAGIKFFTAMACWNFVVAPLYGFDTSYVVNFQITFIFLINSVVFGYIIRRVSTKLGNKVSK